MKVTINGTSKTYPAPLKLSEALAEEGYKDMTVAVALGGQFLPRSRYAETMLKDGDELEIVAPMQGG